VNRVAVILAVVSAMFLGISLGFMGGVMFSHHTYNLGGARGAWHLRSPGRAGPRGPGDMHSMPSTRVILPWLERTLDLTPAQVEAIRSEITKSRAELEGVHDSLHVRIARHLTPEQRERFDRVVKERFPGEHRGRRPHSLRTEPGEEGEPK
jgi:hypothetical protein